MNRSLLKNVSIYATLGAFGIISFQNCSNVAFNDAAQAPVALSSEVAGVVEPLANASLSLTPDAATVPEGGKVIVTVNFENIENIQYVCKDKVSGNLIASGSVVSSGVKVPVTVNQDLHCEAAGTSTVDQSIVKAQGDVAVSCGNRIKNAAKNRCEDFSCRKVVEISKNDLGNIPARTSDGICYAMKIFDAIAISPSNLTPSSDNEVISRNHGGGGTHKPFAMGKDLIQFRLLGPRSVKVSGGLSASAPIKVDNFILFGVYPSATDPQADLKSYYKVMGTSDSSIPDKNGKDSKSILFRNTYLPIQAFATNGTSTLAPLDITNSVQPMTYHDLDVRALDCGGDRELSNVYLLFQ